MKKPLIILGLTAAFIAVIFASSTLYKLALIPIIIAFLSGMAILLLSKNEKNKTKTIQYMFLMVIMSLGLTIYKGIDAAAVEKTDTITQPEAATSNTDEDPSNSTVNTKNDKKI